MEQKCKDAFVRMRPYLTELYNCAYLITADRERAEYALQCGLLAGLYEEARTSAGLKETLRRETLRVALDDAERKEYEAEWFTEESYEGEKKEPTRVLLLHHGAGLSARRIASITEMSRTRVDKILARHGKGAQARRKAACILKKRDPAMPSEGHLYVTLVRDAEEEPKRLPWLAKVTGIVFRVMITLLCIALFWLLAVLIMPARIH